MNHKLLLSTLLLGMLGCQQPAPQPEPPARPEVVAPAANKPPEAPVEPVVAVDEDGWPSDDAKCSMFGCGDKRGCIDITEGWPDIKPCASSSWRAYTTPAVRCVRAAERVCEPATCKTSGDCRGEELCLREGEAGRCAQVTCAEVLAAYTKISREQSGACASDAECTLHQPEYDCCGGYGIHVADRVEIQRIDALYQALGCDAAKREWCSKVDCEPPRPSFCDKKLKRCMQ